MEAALEATRNYYTIYDTFAAHLDVLLVDPLRRRWIADSEKKSDEIGAKKLFNLLRVDMVTERYVPPPEIREGTHLFGVVRSPLNNGRT